MADMIFLGICSIAAVIDCFGHVFVGQSSCISDAVPVPKQWHHSQAPGSCESTTWDLASIPGISRQICFLWHLQRLTTSKISKALAENWTPKNPLVFHHLSIIPGWRNSCPLDQPPSLVEPDPKLPKLRRVPRDPPCPMTGSTPAVGGTPHKNGSEKVARDR